MESVKEKTKEIYDRVNRDTLMKRRLSEWVPLLASEVCVYRMGSQYIAKRFNSISYILCSKKTAEDITRENVDALLKLKYFPNMADEEYDRVKEIKSYFMDEISTSLLDVKFGNDSDMSAMQMNELPDGSIAFTNGVFDFRTNRWLFKYEKFKRESMLNGIMQTKEVITYNPQWYIAWNFNRDFTPKKIVLSDDSIEVVDDENPDENSISPMSLNFETYIELLKELDSKKPNKFFELFYNMAHDENEKFSMNKAKHLAEILGYLCLRSFAEYFVFFIGDGGNGKDTLFESFFKGRLEPSPATNSLNTIENNQFIAGSLAKTPMNFCSECEQGTIKKSEAIKRYTGSPFQSIEEKGVDIYTGYMNCKFVFSANNKEQVKFRDDSAGFRRRMNMYELYFHYDSDKSFMKRGDYYDTSYIFKDEFRERDSDSMWSFYYMAMMGIKMGSSNFTKLFEFRDDEGNKLNDYSISYVDIDSKVQEGMMRLTYDNVRRYYAMTNDNELILTEKGKKLSTDNDFDFFYGEDLPKHEAIKVMLDDTGNEENPGSGYLNNHRVFLKLGAIAKIASIDGTSQGITSNIKKLYRNCIIKHLNHNISYILVDMSHCGLEILNMKMLNDKFTLPSENTK